MGKGVKRTDKVRPAGRIKKRNKAVCGGIPQEERVETTGDTGSGQDWMYYGEQIIERNVED